MKRKIYISIAMASIIAMLLAAAASLFIYYDFFEKQIKSDIKIQAMLLKLGYENTSDSSAFLASIDAMENDIRVSLIEPDGNVSFDTHADANFLRDHQDRPEIISAIKTGQGESVRYSKTLEQNTYYYALKMADDNIIRFSSYTKSMMSIFLSMLPFIALLIASILIVSLMIAKALTNKIVNPLISLGDNLDRLNENTKADTNIDNCFDYNYEELNPFVEKISKQNTTITKQLEKLTAERDTITVITDNMQEGLVLLGRDRYILSVNKSALAFLNSHKMDFVGQNFIALTREQPLVGAVDSALGGAANDGVITIEEKSYHFFVNPVYENNAVNGAIMLLLDVTEKQKIEKIRQEFSANVSHELKTPLTTILGFAELIQNDMVQSKEDRILFSGKIHNEASRLLFLIDDIMRLSQIEEKSDVHYELVNLYATAESVISLLKTNADSKMVTVQLSGKPAIIRANARMMEELLYNLTENAIKYNRENGSVDISVEVENQNAVIIVSDSGIGIPKEHHDRIFERFYRVDKSRSKQTGGTGLGLSIVKHIINLHGGKIEFESEYGKGTIIRVYLPIK